MASPQSQVIPDRAWLGRQAELLAEQHPEGTPIARPAHWGGVRVVAGDLELWQGRTNRLHDRLSYRRERGRWVVERLAP